MCGRPGETPGQHSCLSVLRSDVYDTVPSAPQVYITGLEGSQPAALAGPAVFLGPLLCELVATTVQDMRMCCSLTCWTLSGCILVGISP